MDWFMGLLCGIGLAAACGFRVFVPLLGASLAGMSGFLELAPGFEWLASPTAAFAFGVATLLEIGAYYVPWLDNLLDIVGTPIAAAAGILLTASVLTDVSPLLRWTLAVITGGSTAGFIQGGTLLVRGASTVGTGGSANPALAMIELVSSIVMTLLAILLPLLAGLLLLTIVVLCIATVRHVSRMRHEQPPRPAG